MAADITAIVLTVACAAIAAFCALLLVRLWRAGSDKSAQAVPRASRPPPASRRH